MGRERQGEERLSVRGLRESCKAVAKAVLEALERSSVALEELLRRDMEVKRRCTSYVSDARRVLGTAGACGKR